METNSRTPGPNDVVTDHPRLPGWYFPLMAAVLAVVLAAQMASSASRIVLLGAAVVVILMTNSHVQRTTGVIWDSTRLRGQVPFLVVILAVIAATAIAVAMTEATWIWAVGAGVAALVVLITGVVYRRHS